ncbi:MAG: ATP-binding protein [Bacteroidota bacterium]|nr:ATP-binding protein [Bacteroidota bacterium]MDP4213606.1 ATP-binding protein [Bacteroidota bacterium]MDP4250971.1 ATP-binding protein [Bacteroidota bacterium]
MKKMITPVFMLVMITANAQQHQLVKLWETDSVVAVPESVLPDLNQNILYVSLIDGGPWDVDGKGGIAKLGANGKNYNGHWVTGLNAPKGLGRYGNKLYAADISDVVVVDATTGKLIKKISIEGASGLNDITVSDKGVVYVSDSKTSRIWKIKQDIPSLYLEHVQGANGLKSVKEDLIYAQGPILMKADANKQLTKIAEVPESMDGIEPVGNGDFIVTAWSGYIYYVHANGSTENLLDTHLEKMNTADIGYDPVKKIVYVPTFFAKKVVAYRLK